MPSECSPEDLQFLWKEMVVDASTFSPEQLRKEMEKLNEGQHRKVFVFSGALWLLIVAYALCFVFFANTMARIGSALSVLGFTYWLVQARRSPGRPISEMGVTNCVQFYREELERRRNLARGFPLWSRFVIAWPPLIVFNLGFAHLYPDVAPLMWFDCGTLVMAAVFLVPMSLKQARMYQRRIDMLDAAQKAS
jgi:hypothetical protein